MIYADAYDIPYGYDIRSAYGGTDIISCCNAGAIYHATLSYIISRKRYIIDSDTISFYNNLEVVVVPENKLLDLSLAFSIAIVNLTDNVSMPRSSYMTDQLARAGTSIGANLHEAQYAHSKADFIAKLEIALKEANETSYWLKLMYETHRIDKDEFNQTEKLCGNIRRLLIASCKTAKQKG